jgi:hypothetical protein
MIAFTQYDFPVNQSINGCCTSNPTVCRGLINMDNFSDECGENVSMLIVDDKNINLTLALT